MMTYSEISEKPISNCIFDNDVLVAFKKMQTPFYYYDLNLLHQSLTLLKETSSSNDYMVHYAIKANANDKILRVIKNYGFGADCVSGNEIIKAKSVGFPNENIVFAGVGKTDKEINIAMANKIFCFNCESVEEITVINQIAKEKGEIAPIAFRINPNIDSCSHPYISTGIQITKFGMSMDDVKWILSQIHLLNNIKIIGIHFHIGSQITNLSVYKKLCLTVNDILKWFEEREIKLDHINLGGGLGVDYENPDNSLSDFTGFFSIFKKNLNVNKQKIHFELGRSVVAQSGSLITKVIYVKNGNNKKFVIVDAGFTELIRPSLYQSYHKIINLNPVYEEEIYDVVGPICETTDCFGKSISLPVTKRGDLLAIQTTGAYGEVMSSHYNLRDTAKSYYSDMFFKPDINFKEYLKNTHINK